MAGLSQVACSQAQWGDSTRNSGWEAQTWDSREVVCYRCGEKGHISQFCPWRPQAEVPVDSSHDEKIYCSFG